MTLNRMAGGWINDLKQSIKDRIGKLKAVCDTP